MRTPSRLPRSLRLAAWVVALVSLTALALGATLRSSMLDPDFYRRALDKERAYQRIYDEVLADPGSADLTRDLLGRLPVPESAVTANLKLVIPPETLRAMGDRQIPEVVRYLREDQEQLRLAVDIKPVAENIGTLAEIYFGDAVAAMQQQPEPDFQAFTERLSKAAESVVAGQAPKGLPSLPLSRDQAVRATALLLRVVPEAERSKVRPEILASLEGGDVASAMTTVTSAAVSDRTRAAVADVLRESGGSTWVITADIEASNDVLAPVHRARTAIHIMRYMVEPAAALLGSVSLLLLWFSAPPTTSRRLMPLGWALTTAAVLILSAVVYGHLRARDHLVDSPSSWPPAAARLVDDVQHALLDRVLATATTAATLLLTAAALFIAVAWAGQTRPAAPSPTRTRPVLLLATAVTTGAVAGAVVIPPVINGPAPQVCQGSPDLCDLRYDQVAHLTSHNAMASTADQFIGPSQDPDITGQLNAGVRALQIDTHRWEKPAEIADRLRDSDFSPRQQRQLLQALERLNPPREGLWLCHSVCGAGALELATALREIGDWLRDHRTEVVTLIIQDGVSPAETEGAFMRAGLTDLLYEPDQDPAQPWPTLADMIGNDQRLVVFAEQADGPAPWYRNFYRYGMETPFGFRSPQEMTCLPNRGGTGKRLFLLNHFVTDSGASRLDAGWVNRREEVLRRAHRCERRRGSPVNFIAVDYATVGDPRGAVDALNAERAR
ncbi:hypothetical protein CLM62_04025 [Streptomyces sp. SA15]|uniref:hypothetical protein n=1 Tax=Streptomyces sp. SA15 TaxID=934019 RepID=UPI000BAFD8D4|nr:hypothetical protein [Streptomyces sp. SA15]PAZ17157.1 hypothetical protein CLM62_04025 [Streptomyces sp. SA15]